jgi:hypothetical protein
VIKEIDKMITVEKAKEITTSAWKRYEKTVLDYEMPRFEKEIIKNAELGYYSAYVDVITPTDNIQKSILYFDAVKNTLENFGFQVTMKNSSRCPGGEKIFTVSWQ